MYMEEKKVDKVEWSFPAPICLPLVVYAFGELDKPSHAQLISKVQKYCINNTEALFSLGNKLKKMS